MSESEFKRNLSLVRKQDQNSPERASFFGSHQGKNKRNNDENSPVERRRNLHLIRKQDNDLVENDANHPKMDSEDNRKMRLLQSRNSEERKKGSKNGNNQKKVGKAKQVVKDAFNLTRAVSDPFILRFMRPGDWPYFLAWILALVKDLLDFVGVGSLPAIGTAITICVSIAAYLLSLLVDTGRAKVVSKGFTRAVILLSGTTVELFFVVNFIPWETLAVSMMYLLTLQERKEEKKNRKKNGGEDEQDEYREAA